MANSDNVLRGGFTPKHVDVPELLKTLGFRPGRPATLEPQPRTAGESVYETPAHEFVLSVLRPGAGTGLESRNGYCMEILFCAEGQAELRDAKRGEATLLSPGAAALLSAAVECYRVEGRATVFRAGVPR